MFNEMLCAYRMKYDAEHVIIKLNNSWKFTLDKNKYAGTILMDLSNAYDCVSYGLLIANMYAHGLIVNACEFMYCDSYLIDTNMLRSRSKRFMGATV